jgi:glycine cleavage system H lipoate-binding protein
MNGIELLAEIKRRGLAVPVLMITGYPTIKTALQVLRLGAVDYLAKPFTRAELLAPVARALRHQTSEDSVVGNDPFEEGGSWGTPMPGDRYRLRHHSWIVYQQDGTVLVGIERSFLGTIGTIEGARLPSEAELVEQGYVGILLTTTSGEEHGVLMPLSGRVMAVNPEPVAAPGSINDSMWLVRILPDRLKQELTLLVPEPKPA